VKGVVKKVEPSMLEEGMPITLELDEANVVIDIHRGQ